jgi:hypothetical protein
MRYFIAVVAAMGCIAFGGRGVAAAASPDLVVQVQAADVLSDLLTHIDDRADARVDAMRAFLQEIGKSDAYDNASPLVRLPRRLDYPHVFEGATIFVKNGGDKYADPALKTLTDEQLSEQLLLTQNYNKDEFMHLNQQREAAASMRAYLESIGEFSRYQNWARGKAPNADAAATQPMAATPAEVAARMDEMIHSMEAIEWKKAQARGMSRADFDQKWQQQLQQDRASVAEKVNGMKMLADAFARSESEASPPLRTRIVNGATPINTWQNSAPAQAAVQAPVASPYTKRSYTANDDSLWNMWDDNYWEITRHR